MPGKAAVRGILYTAVRENVPLFAEPLLCFISHVLFLLMHCKFLSELRNVVVYQLAVHDDIDATCAFVTVHLKAILYMSSNIIM